MLCASWHIENQISITALDAGPFAGLFLMMDLASIGGVEERWNSLQELRLTSPTRRTLAIFAISASRREDADLIVCFDA